MQQTFPGRWRRNFVAGLILVLPGVVTLALLKWMFGTTTKLTNLLLFAIPKEWKFINGESGDIRWYWSAAALAIAAFGVALIGQLGRYYVGKQIIASVDSLMLRVPLLNKIYGTIQQVNQAFSADRRTSFHTVVLLEYPRKGIYSLGFITGEQNQEVQVRTKERVISVFVPTTPNPTSGYLVMVPENELTRLDMPVADGIRFIISLGAVAPDYRGGPGNLPPEAAASLAAPPTPADSATSTPPDPAHD